MKKAFLGLTMLASLSAQAAFKTGNQLHAELNGQAIDRMLTIGYITGVADVLEGVSICLPSRITAGQVVDVSKNYLEANPAIRHLAADVIVSYVLSTTWPCAKKGGGI